MEIKIETYSTLYNLIEMDLENSQIKELGKLFLTAMNDWPTEIEKIKDFITELEHYFGSPISSINIENKKISIENHNGCRHKAGSSISELLKLSKIKYNEINFEKIVNKIVNKYEIEFSKVDFIAELYYLKTENGGRNTPAKSGYRPQLKFEFTENISSGFQTFIGKESVNPGENVMAKIKVTSPNYFKKKLYKGIEFKFIEGNQIMGNGMLKEIINSNLEKTNS